MGRILLCSLNGIDHKTSLASLDALSSKVPFVEWGLLYSPKRQGKDNRYPSVEFINKALDQLAPGTHLALHLCGSAVNQFIHGESVLTGMVKKIAARGGRIQLNFNALEKEVNVDDLIEAMKRYPLVDFITQHNANNAGIYTKLSAVDNHYFLLDASLGKGVSPGEWPRLEKTKRGLVGYAGGLGAHNIETEIEKIVLASGENDIWLDAEGKLRDPNDNFNINVASAMLLAIESYHRSAKVNKKPAM